MYIIIDTHTYTTKYIHHMKLHRVVSNVLIYICLSSRGLSKDVRVCPVGTGMLLQDIY